MPANPEKSTLRVALLQRAVVDGQPQVNMRAAEDDVRRAAEAGAQLLLLPELWTTGFVLEHAARLAEPLPEGPTVQQWRAWAQRHRLYIVGSLLERDEQGRIYNTALCVGPEGPVGTPYRKIHLFGPMQEDRYLSPGCRPVVWSLPWGPVGVGVCYDLRFPELWRTYARHGVTLFLLVAAWPQARREHWDLLLRARAVDNLAYMVAVNRVGPGRFGPYGGGSAVVDPWGRVEVQAGADAALLLATLDLSRVPEARSRLPVLQDLRPSCYAISASLHKDDAR